MQDQTQWQKLNVDPSAVCIVLPTPQIDLKSSILRKTCWSSCEKSMCRILGTVMCMCSGILSCFLPCPVLATPYFPQSCSYIYPLFSFWFRIVYFSDSPWELLAARSPPYTSVLPDHEAKDDKAGGVASGGAGLNRGVMGLLTS